VNKSGAPLGRRSAPPLYTGGLTPRRSQALGRSNAAQRDQARRTVRSPVRTRRSYTGGLTPRRSQALGRSNAAQREQERRTVRSPVCTRALHRRADAAPLMR